MSKIPLLMTRPGGTNASFVQLIASDLRARVQIIDCPLIRIEPVSAHANLAPNATVIFTSMNGVKFAPPAGQRMAFCVGQRTTQAARREGWDAVFAGQTAEELVEYIIADAPTGPLVHLSGRHVRGEIAERLSAAGFPTDRIALYDQILLPLSTHAEELLEQNTPVIVPLFSPRSAAQFAAVCPPSAPVLIAALSSAVLESLGNMQFIQSLVAREPTGASLAVEVEKLIRWNSLG